MMCRAAALLTLALTVTIVIAEDTPPTPPSKGGEKSADAPPSKGGDKASSPPLQGGVAPRETQDLIFLGDTRPVLVRLHVFIDGKAMGVAWEEFVQHLFKKLDKDGDGTLSKEEAEKVPTPQALLSAGGDTGRPLSLRVLDTNKDGKVSLEELTNYYRTSGGGFQMQFFQPQTAMGDSLNDMLFKKLDANKDGKLSKDELANAAESLMKLDLDDDEVISATELNPGLGQQPNVVVAEEGMAANAAKPEAAKVIFTANPEDSAQAWRHEMVTRYGANSKRLKLKDKRLTREDLGLDQATFDRLDTEKDGELDREELAKFAERPADIELTMRLGTRAAGQPQLELYGAKEATLQSSVRKIRGGLGLDLGKTLAEMRVNDQGAIQAKINSQVARQSMMAQFKQADMDNNGYLEMKEVEQNPAFAALFKTLDTDNDGKVFEKELIAYLDTALDIQGRAQSARAIITVADQGKGLFDLIDVNHDGRLTIRELRNAALILETADRNGDGFLASDEIPRSYQLTVSRDPMGNQFGRRAVVIVRGMGGSQVQSDGGAGPLWFRKMDRNRDGDVSRREFLGTAAQFKQIDTDDDGLISVQEAEKFDGEKRKK